MRDRADKIFSAALDLPIDERERFISDACAEETLLHQKVERLLLASEDSGSFMMPGGALHGPIWDDLSTELASVRGAPDPDRIGAYRIIRELGRGGMAVVYLAERADGQFEQQVALKLLKLGRDSEELILRFQQERQILASLNHPAIARLLDGGVTTDGRPFIVMEQVEGEPIDRYCDQHHLTVEERLEFFVQVARAVHYAHQNLVVHRDLKPSNILVTSGGQVKLLDFGIAKLLDQNPPQYAAPTTRSSVRVLTPEYASPEQILGAPITTASDVYQLGLLLYELLCGRRPYQLQKRTPSEVERVICQQVPVLPSVATTSSYDRAEVVELTREEVSKLRGTRPERLRKRLAGDLDMIVMMALRKEPERRYGSAEQLGRDIERHLSGQPVSARRDTFGYRFRKLVQRHRAEAIASFVVALLIVVLIGYYTARLTRERDRARLDAEKATEVSLFLEGLFQVADSSLSRGEEVSAREILDQGADRIRELSDKPRIQVEMQTLLGNIYCRLGMYDRAGSMLEQAMVAHNDLSGDEQLSLAVSLSSLAGVYTNQGRYAEAETLYRRALDIHERLLDSDDLRLARSRCSLASLYIRRDGFAKAEALLEQSHATFQKQMGANHHDVLQSLALLRTIQGRYEEAETLYRQALESRERAFGPEHVDLVPLLRQLSGMARIRSDLAEVEALNRRALTILESNLGPNHPELGLALRRLAASTGLLGNHREAEMLYRRALEIQERALGPHHPLLAATLHSLAGYRGATGGLAEAEQLDLRALTIYEEILGTSHIRVGVILNSLACLATVQGKLREAELYCRRSLEVCQEQEVEHTICALALDTLACIYRDQGKLNASEPLFLEAIEKIEHKYGPEEPNLAEMLRNLAQLRTKQARYNDAESDYKRALSLARKSLDEAPDAPRRQAILASIEVSLGELYQQTGDRGRALAHWNRADELTLAIADGSVQVELLSVRATVLLRLGRVAEALPIVDRVLATGWRRRDLVDLCESNAILIGPTTPQGY
jgi:serine/threonine-protein kinase